MAETLHLPDGSMEVLFSREDFQRLIREKLGFDAELKIIELINEADYTKQKISTDLESYESSLDSNNTCFLDILDIVQDLQTLLQEKRINKTKISKSIEQIEKLISNQI